MSAEPVYRTCTKNDNDAMTDHHAPVPSRPSKPGGFTVDEFFDLPDLLPHTELVDGRLVVVSPQGNFHSVVCWVLRSGIERTRPDSVRVRDDMATLLPRGTVRCPDVMVLRAEVAMDLTKDRFVPGDLILAAEVVSPSSRKTDRQEKPVEYATAGIQHFWRVEKEDGQPVVYVHELDPTTQAYELAGVHHERLKLTVPFDIDIDLTEIHRI